MPEISFTKVEKWTISELIQANLDQTNRKKILIPRFQRELVWNDTKKKELIESIKSGFPIGAFLLYNAGSENNLTTYQLIDGLQRFSTIKSYCLEPTKFFSSSEISESLLNSIEYFCTGKKIIFNRDEVVLKIVEWVRSITSFNEMNGYSSFSLADFLNTNLFNNELDVPTIRELVLLLTPHLEKLKKESNILGFEVPLIVYSGSVTNLPHIFNKINSSGVTLSKYQVFAATWSNYDPVMIPNMEIINRVKQKYDSYIEKGLEVDNYDPIAFATQPLNYFEILFGASKFLVEKFPLLFGRPSGHDETDSTAFNLVSLCKSLDLKEMNKLPEVLREMDNKKLSRYLDLIFDVAGEVTTILKPFIGIKANRKNSTNNYPVYHSELQICSIIAKAFSIKYDDDFNFNDNYEINYSDFKNNMPFHYLYDILRNYWSGTGDSKALDLSKRTNNRYLEPVRKSNWEFVLNEVFEEEKNKKEKKRASITSDTIVFFKFIYSHIISAHEELSDKEFEIDHVIPFNKLKNFTNEAEALPISAFTNLCLIPKQINREHGDLTIYEYFDKEIEKNNTTPDQSTNTIIQLEKYTFTTKEDLSFVSELDKQNVRELYISYLNSRFVKIKEKFFDLNNIVD